MRWIVKHIEGYQFETVFSSYDLAERWLENNVLKGYDSIRDNYLIQTLD